MAGIRHAVLAGLALALLPPAAAAQNITSDTAPAEPPVTLPPVEVVGASPLGGGFAGSDGVELVGFTP